MYVIEHFHMMRRNVKLDILGI